VLNRRLSVTASICVPAGAENVQVALEARSHSRAAPGAVTCSIVIRGSAPLQALRPSTPARSGPRSTEPLQPSIGAAAPFGVEQP
jgi:hypothetical protein